MDSYEATRIVLSRIQNLDPENASKIIGLLLLQDNGEKEMIRLAFGPEALVHSVILKARKELGLGLQNNSPPTPTTPSSPSPASFLSNPQPIPKHGNSGFSSKTASWVTAFSDFPNTDELISPSSTLNPSSMPFYGNGSAGSDMIDELQLQDQLSFLMDNNSNSSQDMFYPRTELSSSPGGTDLGFPPYWGGHKRSCSVNDVFGSSDPINDPNSGLGWRPCMYFARGYCKNGASCRFIHGGLGDNVDIGVDGVGSGIGSPAKIEMMEQYPEFLRSKSAQHQQQKLAAASQFMASAGSFPYSPKCMNLLLQQQNDSQRAAAALMMGEDMYKLGRSRLERNCFSAINGDLNPASRQIYLTFPADSTFREEDVSNYFSIYGPVQDVRIPYQQKRMFGFVTFVYPETVKIILAKGNPHFVCDARVLVKPYKEKGKVPDKYRKQQQHMERGEFSPCGTPTGIDSRDPFDLQLGARMFYGNNTQDLWRRKLEEQADLQQALDLQSRRLMGLQLLDVKKQHHRALSTGSPIPSPTQSPSFFNQSVVLPQFHSTQELMQENGSGPLSARRSASPEKKPANVSNNNAMSETVENSRGKESPQTKNGSLLESLEHNLPDSPFASPKKSGEEYLAFAIARESFKDQPLSTTSSTNSNVVSSSSLPANNALDMASFKPFNCQIPSFSSGHGAIGMYKGTGGPTCPVGI